VLQTSDLHTKLDGTLDHVLKDAMQETASGTHHQIASSSAALNSAIWNIWLHQTMVVTEDCKEQLAMKMQEPISQMMFSSINPCHFKSQLCNLVS